MRPNYLNLPYKANERITVSGRKIVEPDVDWFTKEACGYTLSEYRAKREAEQARKELIQAWLRAAVILGIVLLAIWVMVL